MPTLSVSRGLIMATLILKAMSATSALYSRALNASEIQAIYGSKLSDMFIHDQMDLTLGDTSAVQDNLTLPTRGLYGSAITWTSSNEAVVNSQTGEVTRPAAAAGNATVTLTATIT